MSLPYTRVQALSRLRTVGRRLATLSAGLSNVLARPTVTAGLGLGSGTAWLVRRGRGLVVQQPAWLAVDPGVRHVGEAARRLIGREPAGVEVTRPFQAGHVLRRDHATAFVRSMLRSAGPLSQSVVVAVPGQLTPAERSTLQQVVLGAGAARVYLVEEALAAAIGADVPVLAPHAVMTIDVGASATRWAVIALGQVITSGVIPAGGLTMDEAICHYLADIHKLRIGLPTAERIKMEVGCALPLAELQTLPVDGISLETGLPTRLSLTSTDVCQALQPVLAVLANGLRAALEGLPSQVLADITQPDSVVLVGGGARLSRMAEFLVRRTHLTPTVPASPEQVMAQGVDVLLRQPALRRTLLSSAAITAVPPVRTVRRSQRLAWLLGALSVVLLWNAVGPLMARTTTAMDRGLTAGLLPVWQTFTRLTHSSPAAPLASQSASPALMAQMRDADRRLHNALADNHRLRSLLHMSGALPSAAPFTGAQVVARDPSAWMQVLVLDAGRQRHLVPGMPVVADSGVVGRVADVSDTSATVHTLTFKGAITAATVPARHAAGVVYGVDGRTCEVRYLDPSAGVKAGDLVTASGQDRFPEGLPIGRVVMVRPGPDGVSRIAVLRPAVALDLVRDVLVGGR